MTFQSKSIGISDTWYGIDAEIPSVAHPLASSPSSYRVRSRTQVPLELKSNHLTDDRRLRAVNETNKKKETLKVPNAAEGERPSWFCNEVGFPQRKRRRKKQRISAAAAAADTMAFKRVGPTLPCDIHEAPRREMPPRAAAAEEDATIHPSIRPPIHPSELGTHV